ncbi:GIY-YIG nuclease family protein [Prevotella pallens]
MTKGIIYSWLNTVNGKEYIGQTIHEKRRYQEHKRAANAKELLIDRAIAKYGWKSFKYSAIERIEGNDKKEVRERLNELEVKYIALRKTHHTQGGYNVTWGGSDTGNYQHTEETKKLLSQLRKGKKATIEERKAISEGLRGLKKTEQHKANIRQAHPHIDIIMLDQKGNIVATYVSVKEAERQTGINKGGISACINGKQLTTTGKDGIKYSWRKA